MQPHHKYSVTRYEELGFSSLTRMKDDCILTTLLIHFSVKGGENVPFALERYKDNSRCLEH